MPKKSRCSPKGKDSEHNRFEKGQTSQPVRNGANSTRGSVYRLKKGDASPSKKWRYQHPHLFAQWKRRTNHRRWIYRYVSEEPERTIFLTLGFCRYVTLDHAKGVSSRVIRWLRGKVVESWMRVVERSGNRPHLHFLLRLRGGLDAATGLERIDVEIRERKASQLIGDWCAEPVADPWLISCYLVKTLWPENWHSRVPGRVITYSQNVKRSPWWVAQQAESLNSSVTFRGGERQ